MFEFALTDKPIVLLPPDLEQYRDVERGLYFDIEDRSPGPLATSTDDVCDVLADPDEDASARKAFRAAFASYEDGSASARTVEYCLGLLNVLPS